MTDQRFAGACGGSPDPANTPGGGGGSGPFKTDTPGGRAGSSHTTDARGGAASHDDPPRGVIWYEFNDSNLPMLRELIAKLERDGTATLVLDGFTGGNGKTRLFPHFGVQD